MICLHAADRLRCKVKIRPAAVRGKAAVAFAFAGTLL
jgi:hypothetical protein